MSVSSVITRFATGTYEVTRPSGAYQAGRWVEGAPELLQVRAVVQPASGRDLQRLPEGQRTRETISIWCLVELRTATVPAGSGADRVRYGSGVYEVERVEWWQEGGFWKALAQRVEG